MVDLNYKKMIEAIQETLKRNGDSWEYNVTDDMIQASTGNYHEFTQKQAQEMSSVIGSIWMVTHATTCEACQKRWLN